MQFLYTLTSAATCLFVAVVLWDWSRYWWYARINGFVHYNLAQEMSTGNRWRHAYLDYKIWSWIVRLAAWALAIRFLAKCALYLFISLDSVMDLFV